MADFKFDDGGTQDKVIGTPEGDGDFETDGLPDTGVTSSGGQINTGEAERGESSASRRDVPGLQKAPDTEAGLAKLVDDIIHGNLQP